MKTALSSFFLSLLFLASPAIAQESDPAPDPSVESFFDIFSRVEVTDENCGRCEVLEMEMAALEMRIGSVSLDLLGTESAIGMADDLIPQFEDLAKDLEKQIEEMKNPKNFIESDGRRYDSSDNAALERRNANLWKSYKAGRLTAEEYMEEIGKSFDDPEVAEDLKMLKEIILQDLGERLADIQKSLEEIKKVREDAVEKAELLKEELATLREKLAKLREQLEDCLKRCPKEEINIPEEYGIGQAERGIFDDLFDFFDDLFGDDSSEDDPFAGLDDFLDGLGGGGDIPTEMLPLDLRGTNPVTVDSFFDVFFDIELPPITCHLCDPLRAEYDEFQNELNDLRAQKAEADRKFTNGLRDLTAARDAKNAAERALDALNNPRSSAESEGRRMDSTDQAAMRVRNARLWASYKSGDLSAQELSDEWGKPFDDADVQNELEKIKEDMREELQEAIRDAEDAIDRVNEEITASSEESIGLAGRIGGMEVILESILKRIEECEKRCHEQDEDEFMEEGFGEYIFPPEAGVGTPLSGDANAEEIKVPQECVSPAVPMSRCQATCIAQCTKSGVRAWQEGNTVFIEDCGICPPPQIDLCPTGTFFEKSECESANSCECEETAKSSGGAACYGCKKKEQKFGCAIPVIGGWLCDDTEEKVDDGSNGTGVLCNWLGLFCEEKKTSDITIGYALDCFEGKMDASLCMSLDGNQDGMVNAMDLNDWDLTLTGPTGLLIPLDINGMDGNDTLTPGDLGAFGACLNGGPCPGFGFSPPPGFGDLPPDPFIGLTGGDFGLLLNGPGGNDILLGDPVPDPFVGMDGIPGFDPALQPPVPDGFFGPGSDPFAGGPPVFFGPGGENIFPGNPPSPPAATSENEIVQELVRQALSRLPKLKECEKYVVTVLRQRIGNVTRYTVRVVRTKDEKCTCAPGQFYGLDACYEGCPGGKEEGLCAAVAVGSNCYECRQRPVSEDGCQTDADCDDHDDCTQDSCNEKGECTNAEIEGCREDLVGEECPEISYGEGKEGESACKEVCQGKCTQIAVGPTERLCWMCSDPSVEHRTCEMIGYFTKREDCQRTCNGSCIGGEKDNRNCYECVPSKASQTCDAPTMEVRLCEETCEEPEKGKCEKSYTRKDGVSCYSCKTATQTTEQCPSGSSANCSSTCDGTCETVKTLSDGTKCSQCKITQTTPQCPQGHARTENECPSGSRAVPDGQGCYECVVMNCPSGTSKDECPSSCSGGCDVAAEEGGTKCYRCKQSCEDLCAGQNYSRVGKDWSDHIQSYLNGYTCVSGASISLQTATVGDCTCSNQPTVTIDSTVPVCAGTPCGDVACGQSTSCSVGENTTATVSCNWGGWKKIDMNKFQPIVGQ